MLSTTIFSNCDSGRFEGIVFRGHDDLHKIALHMDPSFEVPIVPDYEERLHLREAAEKRFNEDILESQMCETLYDELYETVTAYVTLIFLDKDVAVDKKDFFDFFNGDGLKAPLQQVLIEGLGSGMDTLLCLVDRDSGPVPDLVLIAFADGVPIYKSRIELSKINGLKLKSEG